MSQSTYQRFAQHSQSGVVMACLVIGLWTLTLGYNLAFYEIDFTSPLTYLLLLVQVHLFTGLFITAHDAMHGLVAPKNPKLNHFLGKLSLGLFIFNSYKVLRPKHYEHHRYAGTDKDPDFHHGNGNFFIWFWHFMMEYITWKQILAAAITFNIFKLFLPQENLVLFWIVASILSLFQLFFFGTFMPHMGEQDNRHHATSQEKNHLWAFLSCYFFGYHYEHHDSPQTPWWRLWEVKEAELAKAKSS